MIIATNRLLIYLGYHDLEDYFFACINGKFSSETVIRTKCGLLSNSIAYLLEFKNEEPVLYYQVNKAYRFGLIGKKMVSHSFILVHSENTWMMLDSYIGKRKPTWKEVDLGKILKLVDRLEVEFDHESWYELTGIFEKSSGPMTVIKSQYDYDTDRIETRFKQLVEQALRRLTEKKIGRSGQYLHLLDPEVNAKRAELYLKSLV